MRVLILLAPLATLALTLIAWLLWRRRDVSSERTAPGPTVIERQVVVMRCSFCGQMRPVDLVHCEHCGASPSSIDVADFGK